MSEQRITFRRIRGRIVPIKLSKAEKGQIAGAAMVGAGAVVAIEGGNAYRKVAATAMKQAIEGIKVRNKVTKRFGARQLSFDDILNNNTKIQFSVKDLRWKDKMIKKRQMFVDASKRTVKVANFIRKATPIAALGLFGYGSAKFATSYAKDKRKKISPETATLIGLGAGGAGIGLHNQAEKLFAAGVGGRKNALKFVAASAYDKAMKYGSTLFKAKF